MKKTLTIRYANSSDSDRLTDFRISQFKSAKEFELLDSSVLSLQRGHIYLVEDGDQIISTMQIEHSVDTEHFKTICSAHFPADFNAFETFYLSKGATIKEYRNTGLNSYLRRQTLLNAINNEKIQSLTGVAYENAPRLHLLLNLGYEFTDVQLIDLSYTIPKGKVFFLKLHRKDFASAYEKLIVETSELEQQFKLINQTEPKWSPSYLL